MFAVPAQAALACCTRWPADDVDLSTAQVERFPAEWATHPHVLRCFGDHAPELAAALCHRLDASSVFLPDLRGGDYVLDDASECAAGAEPAAAAPADAYPARVDSADGGAAVRFDGVLWRPFALPDPRVACEANAIDAASLVWWAPVATPRDAACTGLVSTGDGDVWWALQSDGGCAQLHAYGGAVWRIPLARLTRHRAPTRVLRIFRRDGRDAVWHALVPTWQLAGVLPQDRLHRSLGLCWWVARGESALVARPQGA